MTLRTLSRLASLLALLPGLSGCGADMAGSGGGPFGAPQESRLLSPFVGEWVFDFEKTLELQRLE
ncbi:MAG TPA: hypothetical protein VGH74_04860 [Planctomycetaceae bacterium]|jgi:hypothetical protein